MEFQHKPVLLKETLDLLNIKENGVYVDGTIGGGGHTKELLKRGGAGIKVIGIDRDTDALVAASENLKTYTDQVTYVHANFAEIKSILQSLGVEKINGCILDLGVSSYQLDTPDRGFSYQYDAPLDMRMDTNQFLSAYHVVNEYSEKELCRVIRDYGEENWAARIAQFIVQQRQRAAIKTTGELVEVIKKAIPTRARSTGKHPAKRTFQAIRIEVNNELGLLEQAVKDVVDVLAPGGRICVITFHSLEDRVVKHTFMKLANPCTCPPKAPICICGAKPMVKVVGKYITPSPEEMNENPRSKSAKLRCAEKI